MYMEDFKYGNSYLSGFSYIVCNFGGVSGAETGTSGAEVTFNTVSAYNGRKNYLTGTKYESCLTTTFQICKNPAIFEDIEISNDDFREIARWLCRNQFLEFRIADTADDIYDFYYMGAFNIERVKVGEVTLGIECTLTTDAPFAYHDTEEFSTTGLNGSNSDGYTFEDISDEIGFIYPTVTITVQSISTTTLSPGVTSGIYLKFTSGDNSDILTIDNCTVGEVITISHPLISSSLSSHNLFDDFNYTFPKIYNSIDDDGNRVVLNRVRCYAGTVDITIEYNPIVKVGI